MKDVQIATTTHNFRCLSSLRKVQRSWGQWLRRRFNLPKVGGERISSWKLKSANQRISMDEYCHDSSLPHSLPRFVGSMILVAATPDFASAPTDPLEPNHIFCSLGSYATAGVGWGTVGRDWCSLHLCTSRMLCKSRVGAGWAGICQVRETPERGESVGPKNKWKNHSWNSDFRRCTEGHEKTCSHLPAKD